MDFILDPEQQMLADSVARFMHSEYGFENRSRRLANGLRNEHWATFARNGWLGAAFPEAVGGYGGSTIETAIISQQFGRGLVLEPWLGSAVMAAQTLCATADTDVIAGWMPSLCEGTKRLALAWSEPQSRGMPDVISTCAESRDGRWYLNGKKSLVLGGEGADALLVSAWAENSVTLFLVDAQAPGLTQSPAPLHDGSMSVSVVLDATEARRLEGDGLVALREGLAHGVLALCAELVGAMEQSVDVTVEYLRTRKQFGVPIGSFQTLQHRIADMAAEMELARSMLFALLASFENHDAERRAPVVNSAKLLIVEAARNVCGQAIQLHGGMGFTEECAVGQYFNRAVVADLLLGSRTMRETLRVETLRTTLTGVAK
ncbi:MAG: acyl-CoA dehydrogenase family protein [Sphingomonadaceae bacterium]